MVCDITLLPSIHEEKSFENGLNGFTMFLDEHFWVDEYSKVIFPVCFAIFNVTFWTYSLAFDHTLLEEIQAAGYQKL